MFTEYSREYTVYSFDGTAAREAVTVHHFRDSRGYMYRVTIGATRAVIGQKQYPNFEPGRGVKVWPLKTSRAMDAAARRCIAAALQIPPAAVRVDREATRQAGHARGPWWQRHYTILAQD